MHEMSIAQSLFDIIEETRRGNDLSRITVVRVALGELSTIVPDSLEFCFEVLTRGTPVEKAKLEMAVVPVSARCAACSREFQVAESVFICPDCASPDLIIQRGEDIRLIEVEGE